MCTRDAYPDFADSDLREQIETALERTEIAKDLPALGRLLRFWTREKWPTMFFKITPGVVGDTYVECHRSARLYFLSSLMRGAANDDAGIFTPAEPAGKSVTT